MIPTQTVIATPNPSIGQLATAGGTSAFLGYLVGIAAVRLHVPPEVIYGGLTTLATVGTSIWHRFFGPGVPVQKLQ